MRLDGIDNYLLFIVVIHNSNRVAKELDIEQYTSRGDIKRKMHKANYFDIY
jgi:hypothetical protein